MNNLEFARLQDPQLSHQARSLYLFFICPRAERGLMNAPLSELIYFLQNSSPVCPFSPTPDMAQAVLNELYTAGFLAPADEERRRQGCEYTLPLIEAQQRKLPEPPFAMHAAWRPSAAFAQTALLSGLDGAEFTDKELNAFVSYWQGRPEHRNQHAWERAFAQRLLKYREARVRPERLHAARINQSAQRPRTTAEGYRPHTAN